MYTKARIDFAEIQWLKNLRKPLGLRGVALALIRLPAGKGYSFTHRHQEQEEVYVALEGRGQILVEGELMDFSAGDAVRVSPEARRALKADGETDLLVLCAGGATTGYPKDPGSEHLIDDGVPDFDDIPPWYEGDPKIVELNDRLRKRRFGQGSGLT